MKIDIVIPSKGRNDKLATCLRSIFKQVQEEKVSGIEVYVYMDSSEEIDGFLEQYPRIGDIVQLQFKIIAFKYNAPRLWNHHLQHMTADGMMYLNDDVELVPGCIKQARMHSMLMFPEHDGVMGITQTNLVGKFDTAPAAFGIVGREFAAKFPDYRAFCPDYKHLWIDRELEMYARSIDKFFFSCAGLIHHHPCTGASLTDKTHNDIRKCKAEDKATWDKRRSMDLLWGQSLELIHPEEW